MNRDIEYKGGSRHLLMQHCFQVQLYIQVFTKHYADKSINNF